MQIRLDLSSIAIPIEKAMEELDLIQRAGEGSDQSDDQGQVENGDGSHDDPQK